MEKSLFTFERLQKDEARDYDHIKSTKIKYLLKDWSIFNTSTGPEPGPAGR